MPAQAGSEGSTESAKVSAAGSDAAAGDAGYLPALYANQAKEVEPVRETF
jgi:hypothetical protein